MFLEKNILASIKCSTRVSSIFKMIEFRMKGIISSQGPKFLKFHVLSLSTTAMFSISQTAHLLVSANNRSTILDSSIEGMLAPFSA